MDSPAQAVGPGIVWHLPGSSLLAGDRRGTDAVLGFFGRTMELTAGTFRADLHEVVIDAVGLHVARGKREGRTLEDRQVLVFHVRDGKLTASVRVTGQ